MQSGANSWANDIAAYFRFVHLRRADSRFGLFPSFPKSIAILAIFAVVIYALFIWADPQLLAWIRQPGREIPAIFQIITKFGQVNWMLTITGVVLIALSLFNANRFKGHQNLVWHRIFLHAYFAFTATAFSGMLGSLLKNSIGRARPAFTPEGSIWMPMPFEFVYKYASFPSGHATTGGAIALVLALLFPRWRWFFILAGLTIAISRPVLGVHFPSDVVAGFAFGAAFVWIYARQFARKRLLFKFNNNGTMVLRGEGRGKMHLVKAMARKIIKGQT